MDIAAWLRELGLERYEQAFRENDIDAEILPKLTAEDLSSIGVASVGHRRKLLEAIAALNAASAAAEAPDGAANGMPPQPRPDVAGTSEAERRQLTVLFCDLVGSTELATRLDPEDMGALVHAYHAACKDVVTRWDGHIAKYMGDGVLAYFGYPHAHEDDAERAVRAGLELAAAIEALKTDADRALAGRIGIATGLVMVGELIGEGAAQEHTVVGDTPNLAARLQALADPGTVVVAASTRRLLGGLFELRDLGVQQLRGFAEPIRAWQVVKESTTEGRFEALRGRHLIPLVGREEELHLLLRRFDQAKEGEGQVVLLSGEPGIGKSRLLRAFRERLGDEPYTPLTHYCSPYHQNSAFHPFIGLLERAARLSVEDEPDQQIAKLETLLGLGTTNLDEAVPIVAALLSIPTGERYPPLKLAPQQLKERTVAVLMDQLVGLARRQPVLALHEDVHWMDPSSLDLLDQAVDRVQDLPVLMVITFRPDFAPPWAAHGHVTTLSLSRLTRRDSAAVVSGVTGGRALPTEVLDHILSKTDGVPLFVEELTKTVLESGLVVDAGDRYALCGPAPPLAIPSSLRDSLMARLDRLAPVKEVAQIGAVIGREFSDELLRAVVQMDEDRLRDVLDQLVASELVFRRGSPPRAAYSFKHALVQDAAYQSLLRSRRQQLHARIATALEERFPETARTEPELLAHHFTEAGLTEVAVKYWLRAGRRAAERSASMEAVGHLTKGLSLVEKQPETPERARRELDLLVALGPVLMATKGFAAPEIEQTYMRARELCKRTGETSQAFPVTWGLWIAHQQTGRVDTAREFANQLLAVAEQSNDEEQLLQAHHSAWTTLFISEELQEALTHMKRGMALYDLDRHRSHAFIYGGHDPGVCCRMLGALTVWLLGFPDQARTLSDEAVDLAGRLGHPFSLGLALSFAASVHKWRREPELVQRRVAALLELQAQQRLSLAHFSGTAKMLRGWADSSLGRSQSGLDDLRAGLAEVRETGFKRVVFQLALLAEALGWSGEIDEGLDAIAKAIETIEATGERLWEAEAYRLRGELLLLSAKPDRREAAQLFERALEAARSHNVRSLELRAAMSLARLRHEQNQRTEAHDLLAPIYDWFTEGFETPDLIEAKKLLDELQ